MKTCIITPAREPIDRRVSQPVAESGLPWMIVYEQSDLVKARSALLSQALQKGAERVILLDADVVTTPGALRWLAETDSLTPHEALFGRYVQRDGVRWSFQPQNAELYEQMGSDGLVALDWAGLGLCAIHRESLQRVASRLPRIELPGEVGWWPFCLPIVDPPDYLGDDRALCRRLRENKTALMLRKGMIAGHLVTGVLTRPNPVPEESAGRGTPASAQDAAKGTPTARTPRRASPTKSAQKGSPRHSSKKAPTSRGNRPSRKPRGKARA